MFEFLFWVLYVAFETRHYSWKVREVQDT